MNKNTEENIMMLLRTLADNENWRLLPNIVKGEFVGNDLFWIKESYDPMYVAQDLLDEISV